MGAPMFMRPVTEKLAGRSSWGTLRGFAGLRESILQKHGAEIAHSLRLCTSSYNISPAPISTKLQKQFLAACSDNVEQIMPGFHGTPICNYPSIFKKGLLIPGANNGIKVANGSVYGNGVYVAKLANPWLSQGFARGASQMLICAVADDSVAMSSPQQVGALTRHQQSNNVHHVGDAMVVFDANRVVPLFVANWPCVSDGIAIATHAASVGAGVAHRCASTSQSRTAARTTLELNYFAWHRCLKHRRGSWLKKHLPERREALSRTWDGKWRAFPWVWRRLWFV